MHSLSYQHNRLWEGDADLRFVDAYVNTSYNGEHFLGTLSYTSLLSINSTAAIVTYDLRSLSYQGLPETQAGFSMEVSFA